MRFFRIKPRRVSSAKLDAEDEGQGLLELQHRQYQKLPKPEQQPKTKPGLCSSSADAKTVSQQQIKEDSLAEIVTLKASIHCQGCARRIKKTVSRLQGVNSFHVDIDEQKVTVIGNVSPDAVLQSVNKVVKNVEFWHSPTNPQEPLQPPQKHQTIASLIAPESKH